MEETVEALVFGIGRFLAGRPMGEVKRTDATFWRPGARVLPKVEGQMSRSSYWPGWQRLAFRISVLAAAGAGGLQAGWVHQDATVATAQEVWTDPDPALAALEQTGIAAYLALTRKRRELMRDGRSRCTKPSRCRCACRSRPTRAAVLDFVRTGEKWRHATNE
ncbi:hypothetical protein ACFC34_31465 [Streptomyces sp. NPDC056053]|uniref:hypothetical protein n=1 Tax=Streptomyces sp. NPDC056053 TaxID=3345696 RepID=UPI0035E0C2F4